MKYIVLVLLMAVCALAQQPPLIHKKGAHANSPNTGSNGCVLIDTGTKAVGLSGYGINCPKPEPEPVDVPAILMAVPAKECPAEVKCGAIGGVCAGIPCGDVPTCADKSRILLTAVDGTRHCISTKALEGLAPWTAKIFTRDLAGK